MTTKVIFPKSGMGIDEGTVSRWLKTEGETVAQGEVLAEVETAKAMQEVEAPVSGRLAKVLVAAGQSVPVNAEIALIEECS
ncbi:dihydrolipoamide acyltransferase [Steroidobacter sp. S1-65]|uniref:Dihydrolipoamide acyltransferase n=1 Tax=Steroidobacter gossypii TaxID=2805490 RepID=A0ABS1X6Q4_9GAMM|nr:biotin/lipoyl-containing protein [Steroidobacter gossypii]MBM0108898.1 dihydrolipoamide acyltransferase [Steroidobacter gossypii]